MSDRPKISIEKDLTSDGFTNSGQKKFQETVQDFSNQVYEKAVTYAELSKASGLNREVTHEHIKDAAIKTTRNFGNKEKSSWAYAGHVGEYALTALSGLGAGYIKESWGGLMFGISLGLAVLLIIVRLIKEKN
jgi:hypothetical protein